MNDKMRAILDDALQKSIMDAGAQERGGYTIVEMIWGIKPPSAAALGLIQLVVGVALGSVVALVIRRFADPNKQVLSGAISWASWGAFFGVLSAFRSADDVPVHELGVRLLILTALFGLLAFVAGIVVGKLRGRGGKPDRVYFEQAISELNTGTADLGLWAECLAASDGDEKGAKGRYIKSRALELSTAAQSDTDNRRTSLASRHES